MDDRGWTSPYGWTGIRGDIAHYCAVHRAVSPEAKLWLVCTTPALWALAVYRFGRWVAPRRGRGMGRLLQVLFAVLQFTVVRWAKVSLPLEAEVAAGVWFAPGSTIIVAPDCWIASGCRFLGENTLGVGGRPGARGVPRLGARCVLGPGAVVVGPVSMPDDSVLAANSVLARSPTEAGGWVGIPAKRYEGQPDSLTPDRAGGGARSSAVEGESMSAEAPPHPPRDPHEPFWPRFQVDIQRYLKCHGPISALATLKLAANVDGLWALGAYRFGRAMLTRGGLLGRLGWIPYRILETLVRWVTGVHLHWTAKLAPGFYIGHFGPIFIGPGVRIGERCSIGQMGYVGASEHLPDAAPVLGDRVYLGVGAKVIGSPRIGNGAAIGANAVVLEDVPENAVVVGNPGQVINFKGSEDFL